MTVRILTALHRGGFSKWNLRHVATFERKQNSREVLGNAKKLKVLSRSCTAVAVSGALLPVTVKIHQINHQKKKQVAVFGLDYLWIPKLGHFWHNPSGLTGNCSGPWAFVSFNLQMGKEVTAWLVPLHKSTALFPLVHRLIFNIQTWSFVCLPWEIISCVNTPCCQVLPPALSVTNPYLYSLMPSYRSC